MTVKDTSMTTQEAGKKGGDLTLKRYGKAYFKKLGGRPKTCRLCGKSGHDRRKCKAV